MDIDVQQIANDLKDITIPILQHTHADLIRFAKDTENLETADVLVVVSRDPLMAINLLRDANNIHHKHFDSELTSINRAIMLFGITPFLNRFRQIDIVEEKCGAQPAILKNMLHCMNRSYLAAMFAKDWASLRLDTRAEEVYLAALLHDMAEIVSWCFAPALALEYERTMAKGMSVRNYYPLLGEFRAALAKVWHIPKMLVEMMEEPRPEEPRSVIVSLANRVARHAQSGWYTREMENDIETLANLLHISVAVAAERIHHTAVTAGRSWQRFGVLPAAALLPLVI